MWGETQIELAMSLLREIARIERQEVSEQQLRIRALLYLQHGRQQVLEGAQAAAAAMVDAREAMRRARATLAAATDNTSPIYFADPAWSRLVAALQRHRDMLLAFPGVMGVGPAYRRRKHTRMAELCVAVYVREKRTATELDGVAHIPPSVEADDGVPVPTDVVALGTMRRQRFAGGSLGPQNKHLRGTIGAYGRDAVTGDLVAITAMHVAGRKERGNGEVEFVSPSIVEGGDQHLGFLQRGTQTRIDAATVRITPPTAPVNELPGIGAIKGWRPVSIPGDYDTPVRMWGAKTGAVVAGVITEPLVFLPKQRLDAVIMANIPSQGGDSGAALLDADNYVLGFLVGKVAGLNGARLFSPAPLVLSLLVCDLI